ncbi:DMT family transporter [Bacillus testis]|uniref:DMT family transporter n=1 Tax=Bacillus testis TaxID=1622072 RepID=UPI00067F72DC|nr:DMT family transporter [Bacillus testis]
MNKSVTADLSLLAVVFVWGATFVVVQDAISFLAPFSFNSIRFFLAFLALFLFYLFFTDKKKSHFTRKSVTSGIILGFWLCLGYGLQTLGLLYTTPAKAGFITGLSVVLVPLLSFFLLKQRLNKNMMIGVASATIGLYMITALQASSFGMGDFLVLLSAISFAMHIITTGKYARHCSALPLTLVQIGTVSALSFICSLLFEHPKTQFQLDILLKKEVVFALLITAIFATAFAFLAQTYFQAYTTAARVALIFSLEPVFAALTSFIMIGETFTISMVVGCCLIFAGIIAAEIPVKKKEEMPDEEIMEEVS